MRIELKQIRLEDAEKIALWKSDKKLSESILSTYKKTNVQEATNWIVLNSASDEQYLGGIYLNDTLVGVARLMFINQQDKNAELGIYIGDASHRGIGLGKKSIKMLLNHGFTQYHLHKIYLRVTSNNTAAIKTYLSCGFEIEGHLVNHYYNGSEFLDIIYMAIFDRKET